jgi:hypothetical protein
VDTSGEERKDMAEPISPQQHAHHYYGRTTTDQDHFHVFDGTTGANYETDQGHVHRFSTETSRAHGHTHRMHGTTSLQIRSLGGHVHQISGITSFDDGHTHRFDVFSGPPVRPRTRRPRLMSLGRALRQARDGELSPPRRRRLRFRKISSSSQRQ